MKINDEQKNNYIILINPLNILYTYNFGYIKRSNHSKYFNLLINNIIDSFHSDTNFTFGKI